MHFIMKSIKNTHYFRKHLHLLMVCIAAPALFAQDTLQLQDWEVKVNRDVIKAEPTGNVGVGTENPEEKVHIKGGTIRVEDMEVIKDTEPAVGGTAQNPSTAVPLYRPVLIDANGNLVRGPFAYNPFAPLDFTPTDKIIGPQDKTQLPQCYNVSLLNNPTPDVTPKWIYKKAGTIIFPCPMYTKLGLGTEAPTEQLHIEAVSPGIRLSGKGDKTNEAIDLRISAANGSGRFITDKSLAFFIDSDNNQVDQSFSIFHNSSYYGGSAEMLFNLKESGDAYLKGKVGIGTTNMPGNYGLYVKDGILAEKVRSAVETSAAWSDYVFYEDYKLMSLPNLEKYIKENKIFLK